MVTRQAPPPAKRGWIKGRVEELRDTPGDWSVVRTVVSHSQAGPIVARFKALGADACGRIRDDGLVDVWAAWSPKDETP